MKIKPKFSASVSGTTLEILVYDQIGQTWWSEGITAGTTMQAIKDAGAFDRISVRINSPGGDCYEGVAIFNLLRSQKKPIDVFVDGIAASAASVIAMAGDVVNVGVGATIMIHNAATYGDGDANAFRKLADTLDIISVTVGGIYVLRTGQDAATIKDLMDAETWMSAEDAIAKGFATNVMNQDDGQIAKARALTAKFSLQKFGFRHAPEMLTKGVRNESVDPDCTCNCTPCRTIGCSGCENDPCTEAGCDCPNHEDPEMSSESSPSLEFYRHRLALHQR